MIKKFALTVVVVLYMLCIISGCGKNANEEIVGKWIPATASLNGETVNYSDLGIDNDQFGFEFSENGKCTATLAGISGEGTYAFNGTSVDVEMNSDVQKLDYDNGILSLTLTYGNETTTFTFTKSNEK